MKQITITCYDNGKTTLKIKDLAFNSENLAALLTIDYSRTQQSAWTKRTNIVMSQDGTGAIINGDTQTAQTIQITNAMTKEGTMTIYPYAVQVNGQIESRAIWEAQAITVGPFEDLLHDDSTVTPSIAEQLQLQIDQINISGVNPGGFVGQYLTKLSEEDNDTGWKTITSDEVAYGDGTATEMLDQIGNKVEKEEGKSLVENALIEAISLPRWDDLQFELTPTRVGSNSKPDFDFTNIGLLFPRNDPSEIVYITVQFPHAWKEGSDIHPHVHCRQQFNLQAVFKMDYIWYNLGEAIPAVWTTLTMNTYSTAYTSGTISQIISGPTISGAGKTISSILKLKLYRQDNVYTGDILVDQFDIHIQVDAAGSELEFTK